MTQIVGVTDQPYAPGCYLICQVDDNGHWEPRNDSRNILVQSDWLFPFWAERFGWTGCPHGSDGTVDCPQCNRTVSMFISEASEYLDRCAENETVVTMDDDEFAAELEAQQFEGFPSHSLPKKKAE